ncbi:Na+/H+ antiporter NhaC family protein [Schaalia vaccimaxillae]|uniref:Na+/H+ antiporter NhaC family protein n=1 Tax=Schaalia vaccimaxillae TaxID=183916 RepID=UPI0003B5E6F4|nr:Na+/H+ antiporter NhaC family protein [Schaalia vaccimaxillae]
MSSNVAPAQPVEGMPESDKTMGRKKKPFKFWHALAPVLLLVALILWGMVLGPMVFDLESWPLEFTFALGALCTWCLLFYLGYSFEEITAKMGQRTLTALTAIWMLMTIGLLIGAWTASGTIPLLVYWGMELVNPAWIYLVAFLITSVFSLATGTSWGSAGTIGVVLIAVGTATGANLGLLAGAIIGGAYFGDKMSPLSDTTNMAAMGAGIPVYSHVRSMLNTTGPAYLIAAVLYAVAGFVVPASVATDISEYTQPTADALSAEFNFSAGAVVTLLVPVAVIIVGAIWRKPPLPTLFFSIAAACVVAIFVQGQSLTNMIATLMNGFTPEMLADGGAALNEQATTIVSRGGLYSMASAVCITLFVFMFIGAMDVLNAMEVVVNKAFGWAKSRVALILSALLSSSFINGFSSNQYATAFLVGTAFGPKFDQAGIPRRVLSRSIEDYGTFIEPMLPWTTTGIFMVSTLGVAYSDYIPFMFLQIINFVIAPVLAITGIGCFYKNKAALEEGPAGAEVSRNAAAYEAARAA